MRIYSYLPLLLLPTLTTAQVSYSFQATSALYEPITNATPCIFDGDGLDRINELDGELFYFFGLPFPIGDAHPLHLGDNGFVRVDNASSLVIVDGLVTTLAPFDQNSEMRYAITGPVGDRTLTAEWHRWHLGTGTDANFASWQVRVEQATGIITVHIGPNSGPGTVFTNSTGPQCGIFYAPASFATCYEKIWVEGAPTAISVDSTANFDFDALTGIPEANTVYRFTPRLAPTGLNTLQASDTRMLLTGTQVLFTWPSANAPLEIRIMDATGREVQRATSARDEWNTDVRDWPAGVYVLQARMGDAVFTQRFVRP